MKCDLNTYKSGELSSNTEVFTKSAVLNRQSWLMDKINKAKDGEEISSWLCLWISQAFNYSTHETKKDDSECEFSLSCRNFTCLRNKNPNKPEKPLCLKKEVEE